MKFGLILAARHLRTKYEAYAKWRYTEMTFDDLVRDAFVVGAQEDCRRTFARYRDEFGIACVLAGVQWRGVPQAAARRGIRALGEQIIPNLRSDGRRMP